MYDSHVLQSGEDPIRIANEWGAKGWMWTNEGSLMTYIAARTSRHLVLSGEDQLALDGEASLRVGFRMIFELAETEDEA